jgi:DNA repair protein RadC
MDTVMAKITHATNGATGHRQRLRDRFLAGQRDAFTDEALLELLLTYAIPQQDVRPLALALLQRFGDLPGVLGAELDALCETPGVKANSALLLKLVYHLTMERVGGAVDEPRGHSYSIPDGQLSLFAPLETPQVTTEPAVQPDTEPAVEQATPAPPAPATRRAPKRTPPPARPRSELFANASFDDAIEQLPHLPDTDSLDEIKRFLRGALHYSSLGTRKRHADYVAQRLFPSGRADRALRHFARAFAGRQELRDVCFYRFSVAEPLLGSITDDLLLPAIRSGSGALERERLRAYLTQRNPASKSIDETLTAVFHVYGESGVARAEKSTLSFTYRDIALASFAFVLHSEFPEPGMYDIRKLEGAAALRALLWGPDRVLPMLYELRNQGIISKVSQIDTVRQFTTRLTLDEVVDELASREMRV